MSAFNRISLEFSFESYKLKDGKVFPDVIIITVEISNYEL